MNKIELIVDEIGDYDKLNNVLLERFEIGDVIILKGDLGAGKTHFVKSFLSKVNYTKSVSSPTFTIANFYDTSIGTIIHLDLYRLKSFQEYYSLELEEFYSSAITFVEWGDKFIDAFEKKWFFEFTTIAEEPSKRKLEISTDDSKLDLESIKNSFLQGKTE